MTSENRRRAVPAVIALALLAAGAVISCYSLTRPGYPPTFDAWPHLSRTKIVYEAIRDGHSPFYSFMFYCGFPALRFYSPLLHLAAGALAAATGGDILFALKFILVLCQVLSAAAMLLFLRRRFGDDLAAALGALVYTIVPWRAHHIMQLGNFPQALSYLWLPLMFLLADRLMDRPGRRDALLLGLVVALSVLSHIVYALAACAFLAVVLLLGFPRSGAATSPGPGPGNRRARLVLSAIAALGLSAFFLVPFLLEYRSHTFPQPPLVIPGPDPAILLGFSHGPNNATYAYLGLSTLVLLLIALVATGVSLRRRAGPARDRSYAGAVALCLGITLLLVFVLPLLGAAGSVLTGNLPPERLLLFFLFFAAILIASAWHQARSRLATMKRRGFLVFLIVVAILGADCVRQNLLRFSLPADRIFAYRPEIFEAVRSQDHARVLDLTNLSETIDEVSRTESRPSMNFIFGDLPTPLGPVYSQFASRAMLYVYPWIALVAGDLGDTSTTDVSLSALKALSLIGVSHLIMEPLVVTHTRADGTVADALWLKRGIPWDTRFVTGGPPPHSVVGSTESGLALASNRTQPMPAERVIRSGTLCIADDWRMLLDSVRGNEDLGQLEFIPVTASQAAVTLPGMPRLDVSSASIRNQDVTVTLNASCECFLRLAVSYYPELKVTVDARPVRFAETKDHFIYLRLPQGPHTVRVTAPLTPLRRWMLLVTGLSVLLCCAGFLWPDKRSKQV